MDNFTLIVIIVGVVVAVALWVIYSARRRAELKKRFGPEYDRAVAEMGDPRKAETVLDARAKRVSSYKIRPLTPDVASQYADAWRQAQATFVDNPASAIADADALVTKLMNDRGYPMSDFDQRAEDLSVDHPNVVHHYREAHAIAVRHASEGASTEDLRQAFIHYRALFEDLLETREPERIRRPA